MKKVKIGRHVAYVDEVQNQILNDYFASQKDIVSNSSISFAPARSPFPKWDPSKPQQYSRPIVVFDAETGHNDEILSLGAIKLAYHNVTRRLEKVDQYERYYYATETRSQGYRERLAVHGLTQGEIQRHRRAQKASYGKFYDAKEQIAFRKFIGNSVLSGHNLNNADIPWALGGQVHNSTIDTLIAMENMRGIGGNTLNEVYQDLFGKSMEAAGFAHHGAMDDTLATAQILGELLNRNDVTGASLRYVLKHAGTHIAPLDNPDVYGSSGISFGPFKGYERGPQYYISRRNLMASSEFKDPETGGLIPGMHWDNEQSEWDAYEDLKGGRRIARTESHTQWEQTFASIAGSISIAANAIQQSVSDIAGGSLAGYNAARPRQLSFLSNFVHVGEKRPSQEFLDALQALHIPSTDESAYYKSALDYAEAKQRQAPDPYRRVHGAYRDHKITKDQARNLAATDVDKLDDELHEAIETTNLWTSALTKLSEVPVFNPDRLFAAYESGLAHVMKAAHGVLPGPLYGLTDRWVDISTTNNRFHYAPFKAADNILNASHASLSMIGGAIGFGVGGPAGAFVGGLAGGAIGGVAKLGTQVVGNVQEARINRFFGQASMGMNVLGMGVDIIMMPFKSLAKATQVLAKGFGGLSALLRNQLGLSQLGNPITTMTGINQAGYQELGLLDRFLGLSKGSLNTLYEDTSRQAQLMMNSGIMNEQRMRAAARLGIFNELYVQGDYGKAISSLASRNLSASDMALVSQLDSHTMQVLQVMKDLGVTSLKDLANSRTMFYRPFTEPETSRFRKDTFEYTTFQESIGNSSRRLASSIWNAGGRNIADFVSRAFDKLATSSIWKTLSADPKETWATIKDGLEALWHSSLIPQLLNIAKTIIDGWLNVVDKLAYALAPIANELINTIMNIHIKGDPWKGYTIERRERTEGFTYEGAMSANPLNFIGYASDAKGKYFSDARGKYFSKEGALQNIAKAEEMGWLVRDPQTNEVISYKEARMRLNYANYHDYTDAVRTTAHSTVETTRGIVNKVLTDEDLLKTLERAASNVVSEVKTTIELIIKDTEGVVKTGIFNGKNSRGELSNGTVNALVYSQSVGGR